MRREPWIVGSVLLALICALFWEAILTRKVMSQADCLLTRAPWSHAAPAGEPYVAGNALLRDQTYQFIPWRRFAVETLRGGELPLWNPYAYAGAPFVANDQSAVFYPLNALFLILPFHLATLLSAIVRLFVAGIGMHLLLRRFGLSWGPSLVGAIGFAFCGSLIVWLNHPHANVTILLPLVLLLVDMLFGRRGWLAAALLALVVGLQFLGGHIESSLVLAIAGATFLVYRVLRARREGVPETPVWKTSLVATLLGLAIGAVQLFPLAEYLAHSRTVVARESDERPGGVWWRGMPALAMPRLYGTPVRSAYEGPTPFRADLELRNFNEMNGAYVGVPLLLLAGLGVTLIRRRREVGFFAGLGLLGFGLAYRVPPVYQLFVLFPGLKLTAAAVTRMQLLLALALCALGAIGLQGLLDGLPERGRRLRRVLLGLALLLAIVACVWGVLFYLGDRPDFESTWSLLREPRLLSPDAAERAAWGFAVSGLTLLGTVLVTALLLWRARHPAPWIVLVALDLFVFAYGYNPIVPPERFFPETPAIRFLQQNLDGQRLAARGALGGSLATYYGFRDIGGYDAIEFHDYAELIRSRRGLSPSLMRTLGVRYLVLDPRAGSGPGRLVHDGDARIFEIADPIPRANLVAAAVDVSQMEPAEVLAHLRRPDFDPRKLVLLDAAVDPDPTTPMGPAGEARIVKDGVNEVVIQARAERAGYLVLTDTYFPGWRVEVDGRPAPLLRANHAFRAVALEPGEHRVRFHYRPRSFAVGAALSGVGLLLACGLSVLSLRRTGVHLAPS